MIVSLVVAMGRNRVIGRGGALPWHLPADLRHFRALTLGKPVLMGRKTYESIGKPLAGRTNIVVTRNPDFRAEGCIVCPSLEAALSAFREAPELMVIGGAAIYAQALPYATRIYLTLIHHDFAGDTVFPGYDASAWVEREHRDCAADAANPYDYSFIVLERQAGPPPD